MKVIGIDKNGDEIAEVSVTELDTMFKEIRAKAIDEFKNKICMHFADWQYSENDKCIKDIIELASESVEEIAEQLKEVRNED